MFEVRNYQYHRCLSCGLIFLPLKLTCGAARDLFDDAYFFGGGSGYPNYLSDAAELQERGSRYAQILNRYATLGRLLDVGAAAGFIGKGLESAGWSVSGIEPNGEMASLATKNLSGEVFCGMLEAFQPQHPFEAVTMIQVILHFFDLHAALSRTSEVTVAGGLLLIEAWNPDSISARLFAKQWHQFNPPSVRRIFTLRALDVALEPIGFKRIATGRPRRTISGSHAKSVLAHKASDGGLMRAMSSVARVVPDGLRIPYPAEDLYWALYRKK